MGKEVFGRESGVLGRDKRRKVATGKEQRIPEAAKTER